MPKKQKLPPKRFKNPPKKNKTTAKAVEPEKALEKAPEPVKAAPKKADPIRVAQLATNKKYGKEKKAAASGGIKPISNTKNAKKKSAPVAPAKLKAEERKFHLVEKPSAPVSKSSLPLRLFIVAVLILVPVVGVFFSQQTWPKIIKAFSAGQQNPSGQTPKISVANDTFEFGAIQQHQRVTHDFIIKNTGTADLTVKSVSTSCGCTAAVVGKQTLVPNEETSIQVTFDAGVREGLQSKTISVFTDDPVQGQKDLFIKAFVDKPGTTSVLPTVKP
ncbi:MAG: DUF1573 domain-containing protein [bacterium]